jgi:hypothetical protein
MVGRFWRIYTGQAVGGKLGLMVLIGGGEERAAIKLELSSRLIPESRSCTLNSSRKT